MQAYDTSLDVEHATATFDVTWTPDYDDEILSGSVPISFAVGFWSDTSACTNGYTSGFQGFGEAAAIPNGFGTTISCSSTANTIYDGSQSADAGPTMSSDLSSSATLTTNIDGSASGVFQVVVGELSIHVSGFTPADLARAAGSTALAACGIKASVVTP